MRPALRTGLDRFRQRRDLDAGVARRRQSNGGDPRAGGGWREADADRADPDEAERYEVLRWLFWDNQKLSGFMAAYRYRRAFTRHSDTAVLAFLKGRVDDFLGIIEQRLQGQAFIVGDRATVVDLSMCGYLSFPKHEAGYDLVTTHPAVAAWLQRIAALPGWQAPYDLLPGKRLPCYVSLA
jgi:glutathione S-transferase